MKIQISRKQSIIFILVIVIALMLEIVIFNFSSLMIIVDNNIEKNVVYTLDDLEKVNWDQQEKGFVSRSDPMLILPQVNMQIKSLKIELVADRIVGHGTVFYTNTKIPEFSGKGMISIEKPFDSENLIAVNQYVKSLRIDLGEEAGLKLEGIKIVINPSQFTFSISRVIAIVFIYYGAVFLFSLQKSPDYGI